VDDRLELLWSREQTAPPRHAVEERYGSAIVFPARRPYLVANFVETLDGVVALGDHRGNASEISLDSEIDRYTMALLRALVDAIVIGAGTFRSAPHHQWTPGGLERASADAFDDLRESVRGTRERAPLFVVTASGRVDVDHPAFREAETAATVVTTATGASVLEGALPPSVRLVALGDASDRVGPRALVELVTSRCGGLVLCEGGPTLLGDLLGAELVDELFVTVAPQLAGRDAQHPRTALVEGFAPEAARTPRLALHSLRRSHDHLFTRYSGATRAARTGI
jgi:riboflavin biosynthesis pyrimidine reductase